MQRSEHLVINASTAMDDEDMVSGNMIQHGNHNKDGRLQMLCNGN